MPDDDPILPAPGDILITTHQAVADEVHAAWCDGRTAGIYEAKITMGLALVDALAGPNGYGIENASVTAKQAIERMLRGALGLGR